MKPNEYDAADAMKPVTDKIRITKEASDWLVRCDRGLTASEQDAYLEWLRKDPRHGPALRRMDGLWGQLNRLAQWRPQHSARPNPDLLATHGLERRMWWFFGCAAAAAAAVAIGLFVVGGERGKVRGNDVAQAVPTVVAEEQMPAVPGVMRRGPEHVTLPDGSEVHFRAGTRLEIAFTAAERRVRMNAGQAHFSVTKNPARPFIVETSRCAVRAVGTAFDVSQENLETSVLVTEGVVRLDDVATSSEAVTEETSDLPEAVAVATQTSAPLLVAGQRALIRNDAAPVVSTMARNEVEAAADWRIVRMEFVDLPLEEVLAEFARHGRHNMKVENPEVGRIRIGGTFRADQVDAFVQLLGKNLGFSIRKTDDAVIIGR